MTFEIDIGNVSKSFGKRRVLDNVRLRMPTGVTGLLGPNGSGKSTLIKILLGLLRADSGEGIVLGNPWPSKIVETRERVGYLPEDDCFVIGLQGVESVQLMAKLSGLAGAEALRRAHEVLDYCDVGQERYRPVETYSTGMRQKLKFAQALVHDPAVVILDEPTNGLDPSQREEFLLRMSTLAKKHGKSILVSTHILHDVRQICDHVIILVRGKIKVEDTLENLSRPIEAGFIVTFVDLAADAAIHYSREGVQAIQQTARSIKVTGCSSEYTRELWEIANGRGYMIESVQPIRRSLEEIFVEAVEEDQRGNS